MTIDYIGAANEIGRFLRSNYETDWHCWFDNDGYAIVCEWAGWKDTRFFFTYDDDWYVTSQDAELNINLIVELYRILLNYTEFDD